MEAAARSADLLITPEMFVTGYNIGADAVRALAEPPDGPIAQWVSDIAVRSGVAVLYGCAEIGSDGRVFNTIRLVDRGGTVVATHHKTHLFGDVDRAMVDAGDVAPPVVSLNGWRLGLLTCYEVEFGELVRSLAVRGAEVVCVPTANMIAYDVVQDVLLPARALESQVFIAYANYCGSEGDLQYGGRSVGVAPTSESIATAGRESALVVLDVDRTVLETSRARYPYLRDRRPEIY